MADSLSSKATPQVDEDEHKGAVEEDDPRDPSSEPSQVSLDGQIGHRDQDALLKDSDTDFPEPDAEAEHTGEPGS